VIQIKSSAFSPKIEFLEDKLVCGVCRFNKTQSLVTQFYLVAKEIGNGHPVKRLDIIFHIAGKATQPILYRTRLSSPKSQFISLEALQNGRVIASGCARVSMMNCYSKFHI
jgi:hypothetical protein